MMTKIETLLNTAPQTVFTIDDLGFLWQMPERHRLARLVNFYVRTGRLHSVRRGVYALDTDFSPLEVAIKLFPPAYISFTTALGLHGVVFQYERDIHAMAQASKAIRLPNGQGFVYHQLKDAIQLNQEGVERTHGYWLASLERAICDISYLVASFAYEHVERVDPEKLVAVASIYANQALLGRMRSLVAAVEDAQNA